MKLNKPLPPSSGEMLPVGTRCEIIRPNLWAGRSGVVETFGGNLHIVRINDQPQTFLVVVPFSELRNISGTSERERSAMSRERMCAHGNDAEVCWTCELERKGSLAAPTGSDAAPERKETSRLERTSWNLYACSRCGLQMAHHYGRGYVCEVCEGLE